MNIFSFTLLFGVFYYGVPFLNIEFLYSFFGYSIEQNSIIIAKFFAFWALCIFFLVYILTRQKHLKYEYHLVNIPRRGIYYPEIICLLIMSVSIFVTCFVIESIGGELIYNFNNRVAAQAIYAEYEVKFKLPILFYLTFASYFILYIRSYTGSLFKRSLIVVPLFVCVPEVLSGGRDLLFSFVFYFCAIYALKKPKRKILFISVPAICVVLFMVVARYYLTRDESDLSLSYNVYSMLAEFYHTAFTTAFIINNNVNDISNGYLYVTYPLLKFFNPLLNLAGDYIVLPWYADNVSSVIGRNFGFAGNILSEFYYYFGYIGSLLSPIIIVFFFYFHNKAKAKFTLTGLITYLIISINTRLFFRGSFWDNYTSLLIWVFIYFICTGLLFNKNNIVVVSQRIK
ncbi:hypothetical protein SG76_03945 [Enterobacter hormaechei subsp. steigerwaltii]|nr:hypothetical protein SG76_03945 [Enterobacter hormaechei subsp. steigerwaltii]KYJ77240.1 hypothetical protein AT292_20210 [Enterobacter cloacae]KLQ46839.1 hypothetical protein ABF68_24620 [Enterobacter hormaechei subsp. steigerwaltii]KTG86867.1 hypothetical protein ASV36_03070 [Enterobacter hormaechei subsp. steigerwaltii]KUR21845.1 hypothetical protein AWI36_14485 [Enterobacter hormaechei subsp. steigerwaltii]